MSDRGSARGRWTAFRQLWLEARWPARVLFCALAALFVFRATYIMQTPEDRLGFLKIGAAALRGSFYADPHTNTYPPPFALAMAPLALLQQIVGDLPIRYLWGAGQLLALVYVTTTHLKLFSFRPSLALVGLTWLATGRFVVSDLNYQNVSLFLAALITLAVSRAAQGREGQAGFLLGLGAGLKVWPGFGVVGRLSWRQALGTALGAAAAVGATWIALGTATLREALAFWLSIPRRGRSDALQNQAYRGLLARVGGPELTRSWLHLTGASLALGLATVAPLLFFLWRRPSPGVRGRTLDTWLVILALFPILPLNWFHYYVAVIPLAMAILGAGEALPRSKQLLGYGLLLGGFVIGDLFDVTLVGRTVWSFAARYNNALLGAMLIGAGALVVRQAWAHEEEARQRAALASSP